MEPLNAYAFFELGETLRAAYLHAPWDLSHWIGDATTAKQILVRLLEGRLGAFKFNESRSAAEALIAQLEFVESLKPAQETTDKEGAKSQPEIRLSDQQLHDFNTSYWNFVGALSLELGRAPIFFVTPKGIYDTTRLISNAAAVYESLGRNLPSQAIDDTNQAGRCLAFTLPTAAGFHIARATETVIVQFLTSHGLQVPKNRNWGQYITDLNAVGADKTITHHLQQLKDLHRNPMIHPEISLTMVEALSLWSMCLSVITSMLDNMQKRGVI